MPDFELNFRSISRFEKGPFCKIFFSIFVKYQDSKKSYKKGQKSLVLRTGKGNERRKPRTGKINDM